MEYVIRKCNHCGALVQVLYDCKCDDCGIMCCGEKMSTLVPNSVDAAFEKHVPTYEIKDNKIEVAVNHVMESDHYIEWISIVTPSGVVTTKYFKVGETATFDFEYEDGSTLYSYCNKHGLWKTDVK